MSRRVVYDAYSSEEKGHSPSSAHHASSSTSPHVHSPDEEKKAEETKVAEKTPESTYLDREKKAQNREQIPVVAKVIRDDEDVPVKEIDFDDLDSYVEVCVCVCVFDSRFLRLAVFQEACVLPP